MIGNDQEENARGVPSVTVQDSHYIRTGKAGGCCGPVFDIALRNKVLFSAYDKSVTFRADIWRSLVAKLNIYT